MDKFAVVVNVFDKTIFNSTMFALSPSLSLSVSCILCVLCTLVQSGLDGVFGNLVASRFWNLLNFATITIQIEATILSKNFDLMGDGQRAENPEKVRIWNMNIVKTDVREKATERHKTTVETHGW